MAARRRVLAIENAPTQMSAPSATKHAYTGSGAGSPRYGNAPIACRNHRKKSPDIALTRISAESLSGGACRISSAFAVTVHPKAATVVPATNAAVTTALGKRSKLRKRPRGSFTVRTVTNTMSTHHNGPSERSETRMLPASAIRASKNGDGSGDLTKANSDTHSSSPARISMALGATTIVLYATIGVIPATTPTKSQRGVSKKRRVLRAANNRPAQSSAVTMRMA